MSFFNLIFDDLGLNRKGYFFVELNFIDYKSVNYY